MLLTIDRRGFKIRCDREPRCLTASDRLRSRAFGSMVCLKGTLYVLGGINSSERSELTVECYDPAENKWIVETSIPMKMICKDKNYSFNGCVLKLSKGVLDKLDAI